MSARSQLHQVLAEHYAQTEQTECTPCRLINEYKAQILWGAANDVPEPSARALRDLAVEAQSRTHQGEVTP